MNKIPISIEPDDIKQFVETYKSEEEFRQNIFIEKKNEEGKKSLSFPINEFLMALSSLSSIITLYDFISKFRKKKKKNAYLRLGEKRVEINDEMNKDDFMELLLKHFEEIENLEE